MVMINRATKELTLKIVYYGPGLCGKTTNLEYIYSTANPERKGKLLTVSTETDRTLFFDFLPVELGSIRGMKVRIQLYTVPGQVFYDATRRIVLRGSDGVVFVSDSQKIMMDANVESVENLKTNLKLNNLDPETIPLVMQYNKQDLQDLASVEELQEKINWRNVPYFLSVATIGDGVNETLRKIIESVIRDFHDKERSLKEGGRLGRVDAGIQEEKAPEPEEVETPIPTYKDFHEIEFEEKAVNGLEPETAEGGPEVGEEGPETSAEIEEESPSVDESEEVVDVEEVNEIGEIDEVEEEIIDLDSFDEELEGESELEIEEVESSSLEVAAMASAGAAEDEPDNETAGETEEASEEGDADESAGDETVRFVVVREALKDLSMRLKGIADETERVRKILNALEDKLEDH